MMSHISTGNLAIAACVALTSLPAGSAQAAEEITIVSWGGSYSASQRKAFYEPYADETGKKVLEDEWSGDMAKIRAMVDAGTYEGHVYDAESGHLVSGCDEGLWEEIDYGRLGFGPSDFLEGAAHKCGVGSISWSTLFAYDADQISGEGPKTWADFWNLERFPGRRGMYKSPKSNLEFALLADGVAVEDLYDVLGTQEGIMRAFAKLDELKPHLVWYEAGAQGPQLLADKEVVMTTGFNGRFYTAIVDDRKNFRIVWDGQAMDFDFWVIPRGHPEAALAHDFIKYASQPERMGDQTNYISYGPLRKGATDHVDPNILPHLPTAEANTKTWFKSDTSFWADNEETLNEQFNVWLAK